MLRPLSQCFSEKTLTFVVLILDTGINSKEKNQRKLYKANGTQKLKTQSN